VIADSWQATDHKTAERWSAQLCSKRNHFASEAGSRHFFRSPPNDALRT